MEEQPRNHHYVPIWYQKRFMLPSQERLLYLNLNPSNSRDSKGIFHKHNELTRRSPKSCFCENDFYSLDFGIRKSMDIEKHFFGKIDDLGSVAVDNFSDYGIKPEINKTFNDFLLFISSQKLRTPKGLSWISNKLNISDKFNLLNKMVELRSIYSAIWTESIWQIADASLSETKFIVSDHPVTVYNRACGPRWCKRHGDPDIRLNATHTLFPLSLNKILIMSNLSWVRNPYQSEMNLRPNPIYFRDAIFKMMDVQVERKLSEQEVREINFIIKSSALNYLASANEEWLYPENYVSKSNWNTFGDGLLLMPDPRSVDAGGDILMGFKDGTSDAFDSYGRKPWDPKYKKESDDRKEFRSLYKFKGEFAKIFGPKRRGRKWDLGKLEPEIDSDECHKYHLSLCKTKK